MKKRKKVKLNPERMAAMFKKAGFTDEQRKNWKKLFKPGKMVTLKYFELQKSGKPRFPIFQNIYNKI